ncbi:tyrosine-type recombinase/integrase [Kitasatospora aureofaciens]|uniref:tyrosine-type recombinase/integrase n=1 Tax=Kitasatospora aureofaciens TaxID=1894 RepID=UPI0037CABD7D
MGEVSGVRARDIDTDKWLLICHRQTTPTPGGLVDKHTKGRVARLIPIIEPLRPLIIRRLQATRGEPDARLYTGPRGGRISTAVLRDATHWNGITRDLGYEHLRRHDLRHTGLTWMADAGVLPHILKEIAGHRLITTTQRYFHPAVLRILEAGQAFTHHLEKLQRDGQITRRNCYRLEMAADKPLRCCPSHTAAISRRQKGPNINDFDPLDPRLAHLTEGQVRAMPRSSRTARRSRTSP